MMENDSLLLDPNEWDYLHEGNQHLILRHVGRNESFIGKVIRLKKNGSKGNKGEKEKSKWWEKFFDEKNLMEKIESEVFGVHHIIKHYHMKVKIFISFKSENTKSRK